MDYFSILLLLIVIPSIDCEEIEEKRNYCGNSLSNALQTVCGPNGYFHHRSSPVRLNSAKGIVNECCLEPCTTAHLKQYCDFYSRNLEEDVPMSSAQKPKQKKEKRTGKASKKQRSRCRKRCRCRKHKKNDKKKKEKKVMTTTPIPITRVYPAPHFEYFDDWDGPLLDPSQS